MGGYKSKVINLGDNCDLNLRNVDSTKFPAVGGEYTCTTDVTSYKTEWYINGNPIYVRYGNATINFNYNTSGMYGSTLTSWYWGILIKSTDETVTRFNFLNDPKTQTQTLTFNNIDVSKNYIILLLVSLGPTDTRSYYGAPDYTFNDGSRDWYFYALTTKSQGASTDRVVFDPYIGQNSYGRKELSNLSPQTYAYNICCSGYEFEVTAGDDQEFGRQHISYPRLAGGGDVYCLWDFNYYTLTAASNLKVDSIITTGVTNTGLKLSTTMARAGSGTIVLKGTADRIIPNFPQFN